MRSRIFSLVVLASLSLVGCPKTPAPESTPDTSTSSTSSGAGGGAAGDGCAPRTPRPATYVCTYDSDCNDGSDCSHDKCEIPASTSTSSSSEKHCTYTRETGPVVAHGCDAAASWHGECRGVDGLSCCPRGGVAVPVTRSR
jgi:hypothetical protein